MKEYEERINEMLRVRNELLEDVARKMKDIIYYRNKIRQQQKALVMVEAMLNDKYFADDPLYFFEHELGITISEERNPKTKEDIAYPAVYNPNIKHPNKR